MPRFLRTTTVLLLCLFSLSSRFAQAGDDPEYAGRRGSEWAQLLRSDSSPRKRKAAVVALGQLWKEGKYFQSLPSISLALQQDPNAEVRVQAAIILGQLSKEDLTRNDSAKPVVSQLVTALLAEKDSTVRRETAIALGRFGNLSKPGVLAISNTLKDSEPSTRAAAAEALGRIGPDARSSASSLMPLLTDSDRNVQRLAVFALARIAPEDVNSVGASLSEVLKGEKEADMRRELVVALGLLGDHSEAAALALTSVLMDTDAEFRREAARSLARFGLEIQPAAQALLTAFQSDADKNVRIDALRALGTGLGERMQNHISLMTSRLNMEPGSKGDPDFEVRIAITEELGALGAAAKVAVPALRRSLRDPQVKVREAAGQAIKKIDAPISKKP